MSEDTNTDSFDLKDIFNNRISNLPDDQEKVEVPAKPLKKEVINNDKKESVEHDPDEKEEDAPDEELKKEKIEQKTDKKEPNKKEDEDKPNEKTPDYKLENERLHKTLKDTQKSFHEDRKKLSAYRRAIKSFVDDGTLTDDESKTLLDHVQFEDGSDISQSSAVGATGILKYKDAIQTELAMMQRYSSNPERNKEIELNTKAFQHLYDTSTWEERQDIIDELSGFEDDSVELTKHMLLMGARHNDEVYSEINESGGVKQLKQNYISKIESLQKELDKVSEKYIKLKKKHQDYDTEPSNLRISSGAAYVGDDKDGSLDFGKMFKEKFHRR